MERSIVKDVDDTDDDDASDDTDVDDTGNDDNNVACPFCSTITRGWRDSEWILADAPCVHLVAGFWDSNGYWEPGPFGEAVAEWDEASLMEQAGFDVLEDNDNEVPSDDALNEAFGELVPVIRLAMYPGASPAS